MEESRMNTKKDKFTWTRVKYDWPRAKSEPPHAIKLKLETAAQLVRDGIDYIDHLQHSKEESK